MGRCEDFLAKDLQTVAKGRKERNSVAIEEIVEKDT